MPIPAGLPADLTEWLGLALKRDPTERATPNDLFKHAWLQKWLANGEAPLKRWLNA